MTSPTYKLSYFDISGLGEPIRFLFHYAGIDFTDNRVSFEEWPSLKPTTPSGTLPILEVDGQVLCQSLAILRYLAKQVGLAGQDDLENWEIDKVADTVNDLRTGVIAYHTEKDPERKEKIKHILFEKKLPDWLGMLESWAEKNNGFTANGKISWADLYLVTIRDFTGTFLQQNLWKKYPNLQVVKKNVLSNPGIKAWVDRQPADKSF